MYVGVIGKMVANARDFLFVFYIYLTFYTIYVYTTHKQKYKQIKKTLWKKL